MNYQPPDRVREAFDLAASCEGSTHKENERLLEARCVLEAYEKNGASAEEKHACKAASSALFWAIYQANYSAVRRFVGRRYTDEEIVMAAEDGLMRAIKRYDPDRNAKLSTFAHDCIRSKLSNLSRRRRLKQRRTVLLDEKIRGCGEAEYRRHDGLKDLLSYEPGPPRNGLKAELNRLLKWLLWEKDRVLLEYLFGLNDRPELSEVQISEMFGVTRQAVSAAKLRILDRLQTSQKTGELEHYLG